MTPALLIVILVVTACVAFVVLVLRSSFRMQQESSSFLRELAPRLGATIEREDPARLTGDRTGRRFIVTKRHREGRHGQVTQTWIEVPVVSTTDLQVEKQDSAAVSTLSMNDAGFDAACLLRTTEPEIASRVLDQEMRSVLAEGCRTGDLRLLVVRKQWLRVELRGSPDDPENEPLVTRYLEAALTLAGRLDAADQ